MVVVVVVVVVVVIVVITQCKHTAATNHNTNTSGPQGRTPPRGPTAR